LAWARDELIHKRLDMQAGMTSGHAVLPDMTWVPPPGASGLS